MSRLYLSAFAIASGVLLGNVAVAHPRSGPEPGTSVEMPYLMAPLVVDEKLTAYAYISSKIVATSPTAAIEIRARTAFIQDAFVRDVNANSVARPKDPLRVDSASLTARLLRDAKRIAGSKYVANIELIQVQVALLRPNTPG